MRGSALPKPHANRRGRGGLGTPSARALGGLLLLLLLVAPLPGLAQDDLTCPEIVRLALTTTEQLCGGLGGNQACYGHVLVDARPRPEAEDFVFEQAGDIADLLDLHTLRLSAMDVETGLWGMALMNLQAYMRYSQPEEVTFLLVGDVEVENAVEPAAAIPVTVTGQDYVNVRLGPTTRAGVLGTLAPGDTVLAEGRLEDGSWLRVRLPETGRVGWLSAAVVSSTEDIESLAVLEAWSPYYGPMQAFYLRSGVDESLCPQAAPSGLLIQTPEGVAEVSLLVNEVNIQLRATAMLQARPGGEMTVTVLEGWVEVEAGGQRQTAFGGTRISVPLSADLSPTGASGLPQAVDLSAWEEALPTALLPQQVVLSPALNPALAGDDSTTTAGSSDGTAADQPSASGSSSGRDVLTPAEGGAPPGLDGELPPGMGSTPPGQGGEPPGQAK